MLTRSKYAEPRMYLKDAHGVNAAMLDYEWDTISPLFAACLRGKTRLTADAIYAIFQQLRPMRVLKRVSKILCDKFDLKMLWKKRSQYGLVGFIENATLHHYKYDAIFMEVPNPNSHLLFDQQAQVISILKFYDFKHGDLVQ